MVDRARSDGTDMDVTERSGVRQRVDMTRRRFLGAAGAGAAAVGLVGAVPGLLGGVEADAPAVDSSLAGAAPGLSADTSGLAAPLTAHISDAASGEMSIFVEDRTILVRDPGLVQRLLAAGR